MATGSRSLENSLQSQLQERREWLAGVCCVMRGFMASARPRARGVRSDAVDTGTGICALTCEARAARHISSELTRRRIVVHFGLVSALCMRTVSSSSHTLHAATSCSASSGRSRHFRWGRTWNPMEVHTTPECPNWSRWPRKAKKSPLIPTGRRSFLVLPHHWRGFGTVYVHIYASANALAPARPPAGSPAIYFTSTRGWRTCRRRLLGPGCRRDALPACRRDTP